MERMPTEDVFRGELISYPGPWSFSLEKSHIILVSDAELQALADPDKPLNLSLGREPHERTLRQVCEAAQAAGHRTLILAFDHFFSQYRPGQEGPRQLTPDMDEYVQLIAGISRFISKYGLGLELSLLSPLEIGPAYRAKTGESGVWMHYRKGLRDPATGAFSVQIWQQKRWANNKGVIELEDAGVRVFAFRETPVPGTPYRMVEPQGIVDISDVAQVERWENPEGYAQRIVIHGRGRTEIGELDRVLVVQLYRTPEMDYFSDKALPFLKKLIDSYADAGVKLNGLYSDEMHIQQDWNYFGHHDNGEFAMRYVSDGLAQKFAERYGPEYRDFAKYLIYFTRGQEDFSKTLDAKSGVMHVFGATPEAIRQTALFRARYYHFLQDGVVDLFVAAKKYAEQKMGRKLEARAHATWAESPTIDKWDTGQDNPYRHQYEYTSNFVWSNTVHQAASACFDYFKWGDFLTGGGNDHAECGWADRNYWGLALACSTGILNEVPLSYAAYWGMPFELAIRRGYLTNVYGACGSSLYTLVEEAQHRDVDVLKLYPLDLVAVDERFGSWMTQYGYANYITQAKLLERGRVSKGAIEVGGRRFTTLGIMFEPFASRRLLDMIRDLVNTGGRVIWSGPPPVLTPEGDVVLDSWESLFGVRYTPAQTEGLMAPGRQVTFEGILAGIPPQTILTDFLVDHIYPVIPVDETAVVARVGEKIVGTARKFGSGGKAVFLGYRPRDDQAKSLGYETKNWFDILCALGAYAPTGRFPDVNDNTEYLSRTTDYLVCRFPNGTIALTKHFREIEENWPGGFARNREEDAAYIAKNPPPSDEIRLVDFKVNGHVVTYEGYGSLAFRMNESGDLIGYAGAGATKITIDGREYVFADTPGGEIAWAPVAENRRVEGGAVLQIIAYRTGTLRIPVPNLPQKIELVLEGKTPGSRGETIPFRREGNSLVFELQDKMVGRWIYVVPQATL